VFPRSPAIRYENKVWSGVLATIRSYPKTAKHVADFRGPRHIFPALVAPAAAFRRPRATGALSAAHAQGDAGHESAATRRINVEAHPDDVSVPAFSRRMLCTACGMIGADARPNWNDRRRQPGAIGLTA